MEETEVKAVEKINVFSLTELTREHITILDLSSKNITIIDEKVKLPINLIELNLSNNKLSEVPVSVLNLENLKVLDLSHNCIKLFNEIPKFCHTIQSLAISDNDLIGPPIWVWSEAPASLAEINLSCNIRITECTRSIYYEQLLEYKVPVTKIIIYNCRLTKRNGLNLLCTFPNAKSLVLGAKDFSAYCRNKFEEVPCSGMDECCDIEYLNLSNINIIDVKSDIQIYRNLKEINLSHNKLESLPEEFCLLENLEVCILSYNRLYYLPGNFCNLSNITDLSVDCNELCTLPSEILRKLPNIKRLDVYNNYIDTAPDGIENLLEVDLAQNNFDEPNDDEYLEKRKIVRANKEYRCDGRKEQDVSEGESSIDITDDELQSASSTEGEREVESCTSDWSTDDNWVPHRVVDRGSPCRMSRFVHFVKQRIAEGHFCPSDAHPVPMDIQIKYLRKRYPKVQYESDGQFDDASSDDS